MRIWPLPIYTDRHISLASIWKDGLRSRDCWCAEWRPYNYPLFYAPSAWPLVPVPIHPECSNKENNGGFPWGGGEIGSYSSRCRFTVSTMRSPQGHAPFGSSLCALHGIINHFAEPLDRKRISYAPFVPVVDDGNDRRRRRSRASRVRN